MAALGFMAGNANENTIGWIGLTGLFYLYHARKKRTLQAWMISGFIGLSMGFGFLMLAPGNFVRLSNDIGIKESFFNHMVIMWLSLLFQNFLWFYLWKGYRWKRHFQPEGKDCSYFRLAFWFAGVSILFNLIMFLSPIMPARSTFPNLVFLVTAVMLISRCAEIQGVYVVQKLLEKFAVLLGSMYFIWTSGFSLWWYHENYMWENLSFPWQKIRHSVRFWRWRSRPFILTAAMAPLADSILEAVLFLIMRMTGKMCHLPAITTSRGFDWLIPTGANMACSNFENDSFYT